MGYCPRCGSPAADSSRFCDECGQRLADTPQPAPAALAPPEPNGPTDPTSQAPAGDASLAGAQSAAPLAVSAGLVVGGIVLGVLGITLIGIAVAIYDTVGYGVFAVPTLTVGIVLLLVASAIVVSTIGFHRWGRGAAAFLGAVTLLESLGAFSQAYYTAAFGFQKLCYSGSGYYTCTDTVALDKFYFDIAVAVTTLIVGLVVAICAGVLRRQQPATGPGKEPVTYLSYIVAEGDTLESILKKFSVPEDRWSGYSKIARHNKLKWSPWKSRYLVQVGQKLEIPVVPGGAQIPAAPTSPAIPPASAPTPRALEGTPQNAPGVPELPPGYCPRCGAPCPRGSRFCPNCGTSRPPPS